MSCARRRGILNSYETGGGGDPTSFLEDYSDALWAYATYQLGATDVDVVRVRRDSDDAESDFNATEVGDGTLTTWTGANDGFVVRWYDQTGNGHYAEQSNYDKQAMIVSSGSLVTVNGDTALFFDGGDGYQINDLDSNAYDGEDFTTVAVAAHTGTTTDYIFALRRSSNVAIALLRVDNSDSHGGIDSDDATASDGTWVDGETHTMMLSYEETGFTWIVHTDGATIGVNDTTELDEESTKDVAIFCRTPNVSHWEGHGLAMIGWHVDKRSSASAIHSKLAELYTIS